MGEAFCTGHDQVPAQSARFNPAIDQGSRARPHRAKLTSLRDSNGWHRTEKGGTPGGAPPCDGHRADAVLRRRVNDRPQQRKAPTFAADRVLPRGERDVATSAAVALPHRKTDQLEAFERATRDEVPIRVVELPGGLPRSFMSSWRSGSQ